MTTWTTIWRRARGTLGALALSALALATTHPTLAQTGGTCIPVSERTTELGCFITAREELGQLPQAPLFWHLDNYPSRAAAEAAKGPRGTVVESLGKVWLFTIAEAGPSVPMIVRHRPPRELL